MKAESGFRLSRIRAEGWNAARRISASRLAGLNDEAVAALNPYSKDSERILWRTGFNEALASWRR